jgi:chemotaxis protein CheD
VRLGAFLKRASHALPGSEGSAIEGPAAANTPFLHAGQVFVSTEGQSVVLILGSCVGVCIWDAVKGIGGATHYMLPEWEGKGTASPRYGNIAVRSLLQKLVEKGANRGQLRAKVFGGGCMFDSLRGSGSNNERLGNRNVEVALEILAKERIPVVSTEVASERGQRIVFQTGTGDTVLKVL